MTMPVADQDQALRWNAEVLGCELRNDVEVWPGARLTPRALPRPAPRRGHLRAYIARSKGLRGGGLVLSPDVADHLTRALLGPLKKSPEEDTMYAATQEAMTAEITYRRHRLTDEFRRGVRTNTRRWGRPRQ